MVYNEGKELKQCDNVYDSFCYMIESIEQEREINRFLTESILSIELAKNKCISEDVKMIPDKMQAETSNKGLEMITKILSNLGKFLYRLIKNAILFFKTKYIKDNKVLLSKYEDQYDAISVNLLQAFSYNWREPSDKLLTYINGDAKSSNDINNIYKPVLDNLTRLTSHKHNDFTVPSFENDIDIISSISNNILGECCSDIETFRESYSLSLLGDSNKVKGINHERKNLIKESLISYEIINKLEISLKEQQTGIKGIINYIDGLKNNTSYNLSAVEECKRVVTTLNNIATVISNVTIESIKVYVFQCRKIFIKIISYGNLYEEFD